MRELRRSALFFMLCDEDNAGEGAGKRWAGTEFRLDGRKRQPIPGDGAPGAWWDYLPQKGMGLALAGDGFFFTGGGGGFLLAFHFGPPPALRIGNGATGFGAELAARFVCGNVGGVASRLAGACENGADLAKLRDFCINGLQNLIVQGCSFRG